MNRFKIAGALKGFTVLEDEPMEMVFDRVLRSLTVPLLRPAEEVIDYCVERERSISGCLDTGMVLADPNPALGFSSELILALGVAKRGIRWRWDAGSPRYGYLNVPVHSVIVVLAPDDTCRLRTLRAVSSTFAPDREPDLSMRGATSLEQAVAIVKAFEENI